MNRWQSQVVYRWQPLEIRALIFKEITSEPSLLPHRNTLVPPARLILSRAMTSPSPIFGTSNVGLTYSTTESVEQLATVLEDAGISRIDTAARYPANAQGQSEKLLGESKVSARFTKDTKVKLVNPDGKGPLTAAAIDASIVEQFEYLKVDHVCTCILRLSIKVRTNNGCQLGQYALLSCIRSRNALGRTVGSI